MWTLKKESCLAETITIEKVYKSRGDTCRDVHLSQQRNRKHSWRLWQKSGSKTEKTVGGSKLGVSQTGAMWVGVAGEARRRVQSGAGGEKRK